jgi:hypothetical protein
MAKRITELTPEQHARMASWAQEWIDVGLSTAPIDVQRFTAACTALYGWADIPWHGNVIVVPNPLVGALAAPIAGHLLASGAVEGAVSGSVDRAVSGAVSGSVDRAVAVAVREAVEEAVNTAVDSAVDGAVGGAVRGGVYKAVAGAVGGAVHGAVYRAVATAVYKAVEEAVRGAVYGAVDFAVDRAVEGDVEGAVDGGVYKAVEEALEEAVDRAVDGGVYRAVYRAVDGGVGGGVGAAVAAAVRDGWSAYSGGSLWPQWVAWRSFFRDVCDLELPGALWDRARALEEVTRSACWWWPWGSFVMVCDRPAVIHRERVGPDGWGSHRLHCDSGPAIAWRDGWSLWFLHGVQVDERTVMHPETLTWQDVLREENAERRRIMAERMGWDRLVEEAGCELVHEVDDPANAPHTLRLWTLPDDLYGEPVRLVTMTNASPDLDGSERRYGLTVPATHSHAGEAIAWTFGLTWDEYRALGVAC